MAKGFTTYHLIKGKEPLLRRVVCEVRFRDGYLYLDHCGRLVKKLLQLSPEWVVAAEPVPRGTSVYHLVAGVALHFTSQGASLDLDKSSTDEVIDPTEIDQFVKLAEDALGLVFDELEVKEWTRIGFRELYYFPSDQKAETERWLNQLALFTVSPNLADSFKAKPDSMGLSVVLEGEDCCYRIALNGVERAAQVPIGDTTLTVRSSSLPKNQKAALQESLKKQRQRQINAAFSALLDIDSYRMDPVELDVSNFIRECVSHNLERFRSAIPNGRKGK